jgi:hypothetical protein
MHWNTLYGIGYLGGGYVSIGNSRRKTMDVGLGTEASITVRDFDILLSMIYARPVNADAGLKRSKIRFSIRTVR